MNMIVDITRLTPERIYQSINPVHFGKSGKHAIKIKLMHIFLEKPYNSKK